MRATNAFVAGLLLVGTGMCLDLAPPIRTSGPRERSRAQRFAFHSAGPRLFGTWTITASTIRASTLGSNAQVRKGMKEPKDVQEPENDGNDDDSVQN